MYNKIIEILNKRNFNFYKMEYHATYKLSKSPAVIISTKYDEIFIIRDTELEIQGLHAILDTELKTILKIQRLLKK